MIDYLGIFGQRLRYILTKRDVTIKELSAMTGVPEHTLYLYRTSERPPTFDNLVSIGKALHVSLDWLCGMRVKEEEGCMIGRK